MAGSTTNPNKLDEERSLLWFALDRYPNAAQNFEAFPRSAKRGILEWISTAKRSETRSKRIEETARLANDNIRANQWQKQ